MIANQPHNILAAIGGFGALTTVLYLVLQVIVRILRGKAQASFNGVQLACIAAGIVLASLSIFLLYYSEHQRLVGLYNSNSKNVVSLEGTIRKLRVGKTQPKENFDEATFELAGRTVSISSGGFGFNNPSHPVLRNGSKVKLRVLVDPRDGQIFNVYRVDVAEINLRK